MNVRLKLLILSAGVLIGGAARAALPELEFIWQQANAQAATAAASNDWRRAALTYQQLADAGVRNGPLFYNMGTAWLQAGEYAAAAAALQRAESYLGGHPDLARNMKIALARGDGRENVEWPWYRFVCAWHFKLSVFRRLQIAAGAFLGIWLALALIRLGWLRAGRAVLLPLLLVWVVFTSSCLATLHQEHQAAHQPQLPIRKNPNASMPRKTANISCSAVENGRICGMVESVNRFFLHEELKG